jgi:hypothetical protein
MCSSDKHEMEGGAGPLLSLVLAKIFRHPKRFLIDYSNWKAAALTVLSGLQSSSSPHIATAFRPWRPRESPNPFFASPLPEGHKHGVSEALPNCSRKASGFVSTRLEDGAECANSV